MNNLQTILVYASALVIVISIWAIYYLVGRIIYTRARWDAENDPALPTSAELDDMYDRMNWQLRHPFEPFPGDIATPPLVEFSDPKK